jgi:peptidoglycan hydrolase CwlO-like protein
MYQTDSEPTPQPQMVPTHSNDALTRAWMQKQQTQIRQLQDQVQQLKDQVRSMQNQLERIKPLNARGRTHE